MRAAARTVADAELAEAFIAAWLAQAIAELRQQDMAAVDSWLAAARRRAEAGADPPYEPTLVSGERDRAIVELIEARREVELTWGGLKALSDVPLRPEPLDPAGLPGKERPEGTPPPAAAADVRAGLEARRRLSEALARAAAASSSSRWALAGTVAREGDERLAHLGVAYRLPLRGERSAIAAEQAAAEAQGSRDAELRLTAIEARLAAAEGTLASTGPMLDSADLDRAQAALAVRVEEGKERPSEVLPLRRQLLEARVAALRARAARLAAEAQLHLLGGEGQ
jgi:outer membrane protein TolC